MDRYFLSLANLLNGWLASHLGLQSTQAIVGPLNGSDLVMIGAIVLLALVAHGVAAAGIRHQMRKTGAQPQPGLQHHAYGALSKPLYGLIWVGGLYCIVMPVVSKLDSADASSMLEGVLTDLFNLSVFLLLFWFFFRLTRVLEARMAAWASGTRARLDDLLVPLLGRGLRSILPVMGIIFALPILHLPSAYAGVIAQGTSILLIGAVTLVAFQAIKVGEQALLLRFDITAADNLRARQVYTQIHVISRVIYIVIGVFAVACILMLFQQVRHVGSSLLASAGVVGIIAGVAGQKSLSNLFAGFQIALAQPMRQDDVVIVEGEWGRVEEITLTYVVIHIWDDRRLVLPLSYFIDKPFQNWTRTSAQLLGSIFVWVDYSFPVDEGRKALRGIIEHSANWDRRFWNLQVSDASERTMQLRILATAADSSKSWDLRCEVRERFIAYIQRHHPGSLPRLRTQLDASTNSTPA